MMPSLNLKDQTASTRLCVDVETCDPQLMELGPGVRRGGFICGLGIGVENGPRYYFPIRHREGRNLDARLVMSWAREELNAFRGIVIGANLLYDLDYLASEGVTFPLVHRFHDVQIAEPLINEHRLQYGLGALARDYLNDDKVEKFLKEAANAYGLNPKTDLWQLPPEYVGQYAEADVDLPFRILDLQHKKLEAEGLTGIFDIESRLIPLLLAMRRRGVRIDREKAREVRARLVKVRSEQLALLRRFAGPQAELMAPESFGQALHDRGVPVPRHSKGWSVTKPFLERHAADPMVQCIIEGRKANTIITTFIDGHVYNHATQSGDGYRIHCEFNQLKGDDGGTIARFSSSNPNLQNLPSRDPELGPLTRSLFIPEPGETWEKDDYSQIEYRLLVHFAVGPGSVEAREKYNNDHKTDFHKMCAEFIGVDPEDKVRRKRVKNVNFGKTYGAGPDTLAATMGCSVEEAKAFVALYEEKLPFAKDTYDLADRRAQQRGYIVTLLGRRQRFPQWEPVRNYERKPAYERERALREYGPAIRRAFTYRALNRVLQGSAADIMKKAMVDIFESGACSVLGAPLITVHDELDWSVPASKEAAEATAHVRHLMSDAVKLRVPVLVEADTGANWGECG